MKRFSIAALILLSAAVCFAQAPKAALATSSADIYVGFVGTLPDYGQKFDSYKFYGGEVAYTRNLRKHVALVVSGRFVSGSTYSVSQFSGTLGPKYNFLTGRFRPYATAQIGYSYQNSNGMYAGDHHPPLKRGATDDESGMTYLGGGGVDYQITKRLYWRVMQFDYQPQPWGRHTPYYSNFSSGIGFQF